MTTHTHLLLLAVAATYYIACVWRLSFVIDGTRYFLLTDDVMITMCYGRTLADVGQLAWYPGGPGGGYSSILWVWLSALAWKLCSVVSKTSLLIQGLNGVMYVLTALYVMRGAGLLGGNRAAIMAGVLSMACWPVTLMFGLGWEFSVVTLALVAGYYYWLRHTWWLVGAALAMIVLTRLPLPTNTMALKLTGYPWLLMVTRGAWMEFTDQLDRGLPLLLLILAAMFRRRDLQRWLPLLVYAAAIVLSVAVGGDAWHGSLGGSRIVVSTLPLLSVLGAVAITDVTRRFSAIPRVIVFSLVCLTWASPTKALLVEKPAVCNSDQKLVRMARWVDGHTIGNASIVVYAAGIIPWLARHRVYVDMLGMNDASVARMPAHRAPMGANPLTYFAPGHNKYSITWTVQRYRPDLILQVWGIQEDDKEIEALKRNYRVVSMTGDTRNNVLVRRDTRMVLP